MVASPSQRPISDESLAMAARPTYGFGIDWAKALRDDKATETKRIEIESARINCIGKIPLREATRVMYRETDLLICSDC